MSAADHSTVILHHYPASPFSEKVRLVLGLKGLQWASVEIPNIMPRPHLMPLTGGYRRTPVMQIGADVYCDSQIIVRELERRFPEPTAFPGASAGAAWLLSRWSGFAEIYVADRVSISELFRPRIDCLDPPPIARVHRQIP